VTTAEFEKHVANALDEIPNEFRQKMENVEVIVEDFPDRETLNSLGIESPWRLLGLYVGVPLPEQSVFFVSPLPERIYIYRRPILRYAGNDGPNVVKAIRDTVIHEIGHHFGFDDEDLDRITRHQE
jgi:predicted Zn-dependent protease with MMP-like domain